MSSTETTVRAIIAKTLDRTGRLDDEESLDHFDVAAALILCAERLDVEIDADDIEHLKTVGDLVELFIATSERVANEI